MKRILIASCVTVVIAAAAGFAASGLPSFSGPKAQYWVELDNAFGLIQGGDLKIAGVRAGTITDIKLNRRNLHAKVGFRITQNGFGSLRTDTTCETRPQSLIGEYFLDCDPGTAKKTLGKGAVIPVNHTSSTVPPDLVGDIMRRPQRERLSIILSTLGAGVGGNARQLQAALRRADPALRETDRVLGILATQNKVIRDLNQHADAVVGELAKSKKEVGDWVVKSRNISADSAQRAADISAGWHKLPAFLAELRPAMKALGDTADSQGPALQTLGDNATQLKRFFDELAPFSNASRPAFRALAQASHTGSEAVKPAQATVSQLNKFATSVPELGKNLAIVLEHLDDRGNAIEYDKRAAVQQGVAGPSGYSGLEALLQYVFDQATSTNVYDQASHVLTVQAFHEDNCVPYRDAQSLNADPNKKTILQECQAKLGPTFPGVDTPDPTANDVPPRQITYEEPVGPQTAANDNKRDQTQVAIPTTPAPVQNEQHSESPKVPDVHKPTPPSAPPVKVPPPSSIVPNAPSTPPLPNPPSVPDPGKSIPNPPVGGTNRNDGKGPLLDYLMGS